MPVFNIQYQGQAPAPDGSLVDVPPQFILMQRGPVIQVTINVHPSVAQQLLQQGQPLPQPIAGLALIDTGASSTCIDEDVAKQLGLPVVDTIQMASATHSSVQQNVYPAAASIVGTPMVLNMPRAIGATLSAQNLALLIGRDVLKDSVIIYNGVSGQLTWTM